MAGRRPKPTRLKVVAGNPGKREINENEPLPAREIPPVPEHLTDWGKVAWGKLTELLDDMEVITIADGLALERLCDVYADILQLRNTIAVEGRTYTVQTDGGFLIKANPAVAMLADADRRFKSYLVEFGLTPAARSKVNVRGGKEKEEDPLSQFFG
ncbi:phage terminase small subunit P27 family [Salmonella enterica subsp. enterica serovar Mountpleasant]|nr:phage terminase small subunit P27 family [Salmonella enterica subsp. enterica serovar Mountpleasant]